MKSREEIDRAVCDIMMDHGPDGHCDGHDKLTDYVVECMDEAAKMTCGWRPGMDRACMQRARWLGSFLVGAWLSVVPLCEDHVRVFRLLVESGQQVRPAGWTGIHIQMAVGVINEIISLADGQTEYGRPRQIWKCSECELPIVRSLESGKWVLAGQPDMRAYVEQGLHPHDHTPG